MMEITPFILALSKTLPESCMQGLAVYLVLQFFFLVDKRSTPLIRFNLFYAANWFLFIGFILTFFHHYQQIQVKQFDTNLLQNISRNHNLLTASKPNLWLQFSFWTNHYAYLITGFYLLGLLFYILKLTIGLININWFRSNKNLKLDKYLTQFSIRLSSNFRLIKTVSVFVSDKISVPLTLGFIKPIIVFPIALINQLSAEQTEAILLHELAHIRRNDYLLNILLCIVQSFLFFNPAIWLMKREINKYREQCCDDLVLDNTQHKIAYARALLLIEESRNTQLMLALASNGKKYTLLNRIKRITNMRTNENSPQNKFVVLLLAIVVIGLTVAWNLPVKKVVKHFAVHRITNFSMVKTASNSSKVKLTADKILLVHKASRNSSINEMLANTIDIEHQSKNEMIADTINIEHQFKNKPSQKLSFQGKGIVYDLFADTVIKSKNKFKIVLEDSLGNKKEYNSVEELPKEAQKEFLKENRKFGALPKLMFMPGMNFKLRSIPGLNDSNRLAYIENFRSNPEWKKQAEAMRKQGEAIRKQFNSPEWKAKIEKLRTESKAIDEQARKQFDTPEFKAKTERLREESITIAEQANKQFNSPEFKKQMESLRLQGNLISKQGEEIRKYYQSPEWKKQQKKIQKEIEKSQKNWRKNYDEQRTPAMPEKPIVPQDL